MTPREIKSRMKEKGLSQRDLAERFNKSQTAIHFFINGQLKSKDLERRFARALGVKVEQIRGEGKAA